MMEKCLTQNCLIQDWPLLMNLDTDDFYAKLFCRLSALIPALDAAVVLLLDTGRHILDVSYSWGFERDIKGLYPQPVSEGICGMVFASSESLLLAEPLQIDRYAYELSYFAELMRFQEGKPQPIPSSVIAVPIKSDTKILGVIQLLSFARQAVFDSADLNCAAETASVVALRLKMQAKHEVEMLLLEKNELLQSLINSEEQQLAHIVAIDQAIDKLFIDGCGFFEMIMLIASYIDFPLAVYNLFMERICYTPSAGSLHLPENIIELLQTQALWQGRIWQEFEFEQGLITLVPVSCNGVLRGFLVAWGKCALNTSERQVLHSARRGFSFLWAKETAVNTADLYLKSEFLSGALAGRHDESLSHKAQKLGLVKDNKFLIILLADESLENHIHFCDRQEGQKLIQSVTQMLLNKKLNHIVIPERHDICLIVSYPECLPREARYDNIINDLMAEISAQQPQLLIAGSRVYNGLYNIRKCYWEATQSLMIMRKYFIHRTWLNFREMGVLRLLLTQKREDVEAYLVDILGPVIEYDKRKDAQLLITLFYYTRLNKSVSLVTNKLHIHANTLYQRIKKVEELLGYNFEHPMDWFDVQAASILYGLIYTDLITTLEPVP